ncbi:hypothetical protein MERGE_001598 [Pneumocystis wakefieldiae]|uniref:Uncharacterized protein n=1 Tax=Pneumocystis wakefieldiae TaxID=38082 RepID=A0A899G7G1_9ASCO|nr:hypothetical protein MERGE_001598 [Pneumocystis wakefieldiae]
MKAFIFMTFILIKNVFSKNLKDSELIKDSAISENEGYIEFYRELLYNPSKELEDSITDKEKDTLELIRKFYSSLSIEKSSENQDDPVIGELSIFLKGVFSVDECINLTTICCNVINTTKNNEEAERLKRICSDKEKFCHNLMKYFDVICTLTKKEQGEIANFTKENCDKENQRCKDLEEKCDGILNSTCARVKEECKKLNNETKESEKPETSGEPKKEDESKKDEPKKEDNKKESCLTEYEAITSFETIPITEYTGTATVIAHVTTTTLEFPETSTFIQTQVETVTRCKCKCHYSTCTTMTINDCPTPNPTEEPEEGSEDEPEQEPPEGSEDEPEQEPEEGSEDNPESESTTNTSTSEGCVVLETVTVTAEPTDNSREQNEGSRTRIEGLYNNKMIFAITVVMIGIWIVV